MHIFKCFENQSDTYHDTQTHYLMEQDPLLLQNQADGMDVVAADRMEALKKKGWALQGQAQVNMALGTPCLGPVGLET
jgi:hypothetical protein